MAVVSSIDGERVSGSSETVREKSRSSSSSSSSIDSETTANDTVIVPEHLKQIWNNEYPVTEAIPPVIRMCDCASLCVYVSPVCACVRVRACARARPYVCVCVCVCVSVFVAVSSVDVSCT